jgi:hypothetical protein
MTTPRELWHLSKKMNEPGISREEFRQREFELEQARDQFSGQRITKQFLIAANDLNISVMALMNPKATLHDREKQKHTLIRRHLVYIQTFGQWRAANGVQFGVKRSQSRRKAMS